MWARNFQLLLHSPFLWPLFSNSVKCVWLWAVLEIANSPDSANCFSKSWHCQEVENSSPKSHHLMGRWSYMGISQSNDQHLFEVLLGTGLGLLAAPASTWLMWPWSDTTCIPAPAEKLGVMVSGVTSWLPCKNGMGFAIMSALSWFIEQEKNVFPTYQHLVGMLRTSQDNLLISAGGESIHPATAHAPSSPWVRRVFPSACLLWTPSNPHEGQYLTWASKSSVKLAEREKAKLSGWNGVWSLHGAGTVSPPPEGMLVQKR